MNSELDRLKRQVLTGRLRNEIGQTVKKMEALPDYATANLVYAGYPYDGVRRRYAIGVGVCLWYPCDLRAGLGGCLFKEAELIHCGGAWERRC